MGETRKWKVPEKGGRGGGGGGGGSKKEGPFLSPVSSRHIFRWADYLGAWDRLSKSKREKTFQDKEEKEPEARGLGAGSRMGFSLLAQWPTEVTSYGHHDAGKYIFLPAKQSTTQQQKSRTHSSVKRKMDFCLDKSSESSGNELDDKNPDFQPDPSQNGWKRLARSHKNKVLKG